MPANMKASIEESNPHKNPKKKEQAVDNLDDDEGLTIVQNKSNNGANIKERLKNDEQGDGEENGEDDDQEKPTSKKRKKKKKKGGSVKLNFMVDEIDNSIFRCLNNWPGLTTSKQSFPPTVPINDVYRNDDYPIGEIQEYGGNNSFRMTDAEKRELERLHDSDYQNIRRAAECHRQVRNRKRIIW